MDKEERLKKITQITACEILPVNNLINQGKEQAISTTPDEKYVTSQGKGASDISG